MIAGIRLICRVSNLPSFCLGAEEAVLLDDHKHVFKTDHPTGNGNCRHLLKPQPAAVRRIPNWRD
jgi:hypothetical protein